MYQVIARKYRPQSFADVVNQEHVKNTLENAIAQNRIAHGYIFSGQRGSQRRSSSREACWKTRWAVAVARPSTARQRPCNTDSTSTRSSTVRAQTGDNCSR